MMADEEGTSGLRCRQDRAMVSRRIENGSSRLSLVAAAKECREARKSCEKERENRETVGKVASMQAYIATKAVLDLAIHANCSPPRK